MIHADVSVAAGRLFFLVLQVSQYAETKKETPLKVQVYATKVWLPFKGYSYTGGTLRALTEARKVQPEEYEHGYRGYYAYYQIIHLSGDKPSLFELASKEGYRSTLVGSTWDFSIAKFVKGAFKVGFSLALYMGFGYAVFTSDLATGVKHYMIVGLCVLFALVSALEFGQQTGGGNVVKIGKALIGGFGRFIRLPASSLATAFANTPKLASLILAVSLVLAGWLSADTYAWETTVEYMTKRGWYEKPDAAQDQGGIGEDVRDLWQRMRGGDSNSNKEPKKEANVKATRGLGRMVRRLQNNDHVDY